MENNYTIYHLHSDLSTGVTSIDSVTKPTQYIARAKECGMKALAFSEHGSVFMWVKKKQMIEAAGMKYIHAEEFYLTETLEDKIKDNYHIVLIAKNYDGVLELNTLSSRAFNRTDNHYYYVPRISMDELEQTSDNIMVTSACLASPLSKCTTEFKDRFLRFLIAHKDRCYLEIQHHSVEDQKTYNQWLYTVSQEHGIPLIAGTDTHALNAEHAEARIVLQKSKNIRFADEETWDLTFKTYDELIHAYEIQDALPMDVVREAIANTNAMADRVEEFTLDKSYKYPALWDNPKKVFIKKIKEGIKRRGVDKYPNRDEYAKRIEYEIQAYEHNGAFDFMLLMEDIISWCRSSDIPIGYGRGSVNGSVCAWLLGITEMDAIKHNLNFDRFMNVERVSLSDIDTDFPPNRIDEVKQYVFNHHGLYCSDIITFNTIADKGAIRDVVRGLYKEPDVRSKLSPAMQAQYDAWQKAIAAGHDGRSYLPSDELREAIDKADNYMQITNDVLALFERSPEDARAKYPEVFKYVDICKGVVISIGNHPCGMIVAPYPIDDKLGLCITSTDPFPISQIYMKEIDGLNYVKLDLLKLDTIQLIHDACKAANIDMLTPDNTDINDVDVWNSIRDNTVGIFQWEGSTGDGYIKKLMSDDNIRKLQQYAGDVDRMTLLTIGNSAIRPAGASYREDLASGVVRKSGSAAIDDFLKPTFGYLVFQCQIIEFLHSYCGFTMGEADIVRRCVDENTEITMSDGTLKKIRDIKIGDTVQSYNVDGTTISSVVTNVFDNGISDDVYEIVANNGYTIKATGSHKVLTQRGWVKVSELTQSDYVMTPDKLNATTDNLRSNQRLSSSDLLLLGLLIGDGTLGDKWYIALTNSDLSLLDKFVECVNARLRHHKEKAKFNITTANGVDVDTVYTYAIASGAYKDSVQNLLEKFNLNVKAKDKHIPDCIMRYPANEKILHLLGGLFSTDGGYDSTTQSIEYYSISYNLVRDIKHLLLKFGIYSYIMKKYVPEYEYYAYVLRIQQIDSLHKFEDTVYKYMVGDKKRAEFQEILQASYEHDTRYNYLLPKECVEEIRENMRKQHRSFNESNSPLVRQCYDSVTDIKAKKLIQNVYVPYTYQMLMADYQPKQIKSITKIEACHVYDIEVGITHNYVANGIIVHNCFAKKLGTEAWLPIIKNGGTSLGGNQRYIPGFINTMKEKYDMSVAEAEQTITSFLKVIEDASDYLFSVNHSTPYSYEGYVCGWLRYHYPLQFLTCALNICKDNEEKTLALIAYAKSQGIKLMPPKFGFSKNDYEFDIDTNAIYKGLSSVKFLGDNVSEELDNLSDEQYGDFVDLLVALQSTSINSKQLKILINIGFFDKFGCINELLREYSIFDSLYGRKQLKTKDLDGKGVPQWLAEKCSTRHTEKTFYFDDTVPLIKDIIANTEHLTNSIIDQIRGEVVNLGCGLSTAEVGADWYCIQGIGGFSNNVFTLYQIRFGTTETYKFDYKCRGGLEVGDVIRVNKIEHRHKRRKVDDKWVEIDDMEDVVTSISRFT